MMMNMIAEIATQPSVIAVIALTAAVVVTAVAAGIRALLTAEPINLDSLR